MYAERTRKRHLGVPATGSVKRSKALTCAAADDDSLGSASDTCHEGKRTRQEPAETKSEGQDPGASGHAAKRKEKEFAWMDSDDEGEEEDEEEEREEHAPLPNQGIKSSEKHGDHADAKTSEENRDEVCVESLDEVQSFGRMMLLAPSLQNDLSGGKLEPAVVVAACRALGRAKFFDHELLEALFACLRQLLLADKLDVAQANDALLCLDALNAYDRGVLSAVAASFRSKTSTLEPAMRSSWLEVFRRFEHKIEKDFLQMLEVPPLIPANPSYRRVRCWHFSRGSCVLDKMCTFSHDSRAPLSLADGGVEDWWRAKPLVMTQNQKTLGHGIYGFK